MPIEVRCSNCGFVLGRIELRYGRGFVTLRSVYDILRQWGFRCPCCLSRLQTIPIAWLVAIEEKTLRALKESGWDVDDSEIMTISPMFNEDVLEYLDFLCAIWHSVKSEASQDEEEHNEVAHEGKNLSQGHDNPRVGSSQVS